MLVADPGAEQVQRARDAVQPGGQDPNGGGPGAGFGRVEDVSQQGSFDTLCVW